MAFYLAVDAGGTKTEYVLADETKVLARVRTGTIKRMRTDATSAEESLVQGLAELHAQSGVAMEKVVRTCVGAAGFSVPLVADWMIDQFALRVGGEMLLVGDVEIALNAAFFDGPGVLILAGTGSNVAGRTVDGKLMTAGGWGPALADQGSGHRIGLQALRALFLAIDEEKSTLLREHILKAWQVKNIDALIGYANQIPSPDFSQLARVVVACAEQGDTVAQQVLLHEAEDLAYLAWLVIQRLRRSYQAMQPDAADHDTWLPRIAFAGSIVEHVTAVREGIVGTLRRDLHRIEAVPEPVDPILGALWRARTGWSD